MVYHRFVDVPSNEINSSLVSVLGFSVLFTCKLVTRDFEMLIITFYLLGDIIFMHWVYISLDPFIAKFFGHNFTPIYRYLFLSFLDDLTQTQSYSFVLLKILTSRKTDLFRTLVCKTNGKRNQFYVSEHISNWMGNSFVNTKLSFFNISTL